jgi:hypothetical protein
MRNAIPVNAYMKSLVLCPSQERKLKSAAVSRI